MRHMIEGNNLAINLTKRLRDPIWRHILVTSHITDKTLISSRDNCYCFPLYLYQYGHEGLALPLESSGEPKIPNFTDRFLQAVKESLETEPAPEEIFYYVYAVLYFPTYRKRYQEFLKIDFPRIPLPKDYKVFRTLSNLGKELVELHLLKHSSLSQTEIGYPISGSNKMEKVRYDEATQRVYINKAQYFEGISKEVWEYRIGAYQVMEKYLKDRRGRKLSLDEIDRYMKVAKAIHLTLELQAKIGDVY